MLLAKGLQVKMKVVHLDCLAPCGSIRYDQCYEGRWTGVEGVVKMYKKVEIGRQAVLKSEAKAKLVGNKAREETGRKVN